ncbi:f-box only protein [Anaeramoeba ignava]|uniref:F-box only protein n=1 Tax=Anaeramoeba ignava TaxID=1746090 RepID=A0A9Q0LBC7_ANAIG|nr:f-box only protein [Anaeramoeba ignava]
MDVNLNEIWVNKEPNQKISTRTFRTINEAIKEAKAGEIIRVMAGTYRECISITQPGIIITGPDDPNEEVILENNSEKSTIIFNAVSGRISKITIKFIQTDENEDQITDFSLRTHDVPDQRARQNTESTKNGEDGREKKPSIYSQFLSKADDLEIEETLQKGIDSLSLNRKISGEITEKKQEFPKANGDGTLDDSEDGENNADQNSMIQFNIQERHRNFLSLHKDEDTTESDATVSVVLNIKRDQYTYSETYSNFGQFKFKKSAILARSGSLQIDSCKIQSSVYGIVVERNSNVVLRSNKFLRCKKSAVLLSNSRNSTIQSNFIANCDHGIDLFDCENIKISSNKIGNCENGIFSSGGGMSKIEQNDIFNNKANGILIENQSNPTIISNTIFRNGVGINISKNGLSVISRNEIESNKIAIKISDESSPVISENKIFSNSETGIFITNKGQGTIKKNTIFSNSCNGIEVVDHSQPLVSNNEIYKNKKNGCAILSNGNGSFDKNDIYENNFSGVAIQDSGNPTITNCTIRNNLESGIVIFANSSGIIKKCAIFENHFYGITVDRDCTPNIQQNIISANKKGHIQALSGSKAKLSENQIKKDANCNLM